MEERILNHYIYSLRRRNFPITDKWIQTKNRYGNQVNFKEYILEGKE